MANLKRKKGKSTSGEPDFKKIKKKVGKKDKPTTHTNLSFQSKAIVMPSQSISENKTDFVTHRNLTLKDLLTQVKHYSPNVRRDALIGIKELLTQHPQLMDLHLSTILEATVDLMIDEDKTVRFAVHSLFEYVVATIPENSAYTFCPLFVVYISAGMTHLTSSIRMDSLAFLHLWIEKYPELMAAFATEILPNYISLLTNKSLSTEVSNIVSTTANQKKGANNSTNNNNSNVVKKTSTFQAKVSILHNLYKILMSLLAPTVVKTVGDTYGAEMQSISWNSESKNSMFLIGRWMNNREEKLDMNRIYGIASITTNVNSDVNNNNNNNNSNNPAAMLTKTNSIKTGSTPKFSLTQLQEFSSKIYPILLECWLECSPSSGQVNTYDVENKNMECMELVLNILKLLLCAQEDKLKEKSVKEGEPQFILNGETYLSDLLRYVISYFPFQSIKQEAKIIESLTSMNVAFCRIMATLLKDNEPEKWVEQVSDYIVDALSGETTSVPTAVGKSKKEETQPSKSIPPTLQSKLVQVFPTVEKLLGAKTVSNENKKELFESFFEFYNSSHAQSVAKQSCIQFMSKLLLNRLPGQKSSGSAIPTGMFQDWVASLPKLLWQLQTNNLSTTQLILSTLASIGKKHSNEFVAVEKSLAPFFFSSIVPKSAKAEGTTTVASKPVYGPFIYLPPKLQKQTIELIYYFNSIPQNMQRGLAATIPFVDSTVATYAIEVLHSRHHLIPLQDYLSFLLTVVVTNSVPAKFPAKKENQKKGPVFEQPQLSPEVHQERLNNIIRAVCQCFPPLNIDPLLLLQEALLQILKSASVDKQSSLLRFMKQAATVSNTSFNRIENPIPEEIEKELPTILSDYLLKVIDAEVKEESDKRIRECTSLFELSPTLCNQLLTQISESMNEGKQDINPLIAILLKLLNINEINSFLEDHKAKLILQGMLNIVKKSTLTTKVDQSLVSKLQSEINLLFGASK